MLVHRPGPVSLEEVVQPEPLGKIDAGLVPVANDLTIVDGDLWNAPLSDLWKTKVRMTVVGGKVVYGK